MFRHKQRLSGLEFACCDPCNRSTSAADAAASFFARISPTHEADPTELDEAYKLIGAIAKLAPLVIREVFDEEKSKKIWAKGRSSIYGPMHQLKLDGPATHAVMSVFSAKLGMAMFREHVQRPMNAGGVYTQFYFNSGLTKATAKGILNILPLHGELKQGRVQSGRQFSYRYNCDDRSIVAVFAAFHDNLFVRSIATEEPEPYAFLKEEYNSGFVAFGDLQNMALRWSRSE